MPRLLNNWLEGYLEYTSSTEAPESFNWWVGTSVISGAIRRRVYLDHGHFQVYPNQYIILTAHAGRCKKSTALRIGLDILNQVPSIIFTAESITREKLATDMATGYTDGHSSVTAYISELGSFFTSSGVDMALFLTDIYDCPSTWTHKTKSGGTTKVKAPYLNILGGTTPSWLASALPLETIGVGFTSRVIFVFSDDPRTQEPIQSLTQRQKTLRDVLVRDLNHIATLSGEITLSDDAYQMYSNWYRERLNESRSHDTRLSGYFERKPIHVLKNAIVNTLAEDDSLVINAKHIQQAVITLSELEPGMRMAFKAVGKNPLTLDMEDIHRTVAKAEGGIPFAKILDMFKHSIDRTQLAEIMDTLAMTNQVKVASTKQGVIYFPNFIPDEVINQLLKDDGSPSAERSIEGQIKVRGEVGITVQELLTLNLGYLKFDQIRKEIDALVRDNRIRVEPGADPTLHRLFYTG